MNNAFSHVTTQRAKKLRDPFSPVLGAFLALALTGCSTARHSASAPVRFEVTEMPTLPLGVGGAFSGVVDGTLIVAGGTHFPQPPPAKKVWVDDVMALGPGATAWSHAGRLDPPRAYGAAVSTSHGLVLAGGCDADKHIDTCQLLTMRDGHAHFAPLPALPRPAAYLAGARLGHHVYVAGGRADPQIQEALHTFWQLDLDEPGKGWRELPAWPGPARILPIVVAQDGAIYVISGAELLPGPPDQPVRRFLRDAYRYRPASGWQRLADLPRPVVAAPAAAWADHQILIFGGDDGHLADKGTSLGDQHPGFQRTLMCYDTRAESWNAHQQLPPLPVTTFATPLGAAIVIPTGEDRPGHRTAYVFKVSPEMP